MSVAVLKSEKVARISGEDLVHLLDINKEHFSHPKVGNTLEYWRYYRRRTSTSNSVVFMSNVQVQCVDIRPEEVYKLGTLPASVNIPAQTAFDDYGTLLPGGGTGNKHKQRIRG